MEWCGKQFRLGKRQSDGAPLRAHLLAIPEKLRNDEVWKLLDPGAPPTRLLYLFEAFMQLSRSRRAGFAGAEPIGLDQIFYWQRVYRTTLRAWEIDVIYRLDEQWFDVFVEKPKPKKDGHGH